MIVYEGMYGKELMGQKRKEKGRRGGKRRGKEKRLFYGLLSIPEKKENYTNYPLLRR